MSKFKFKHFYLNRGAILELHAVLIHPLFYPLSQQMGGYAQDHHNPIQDQLADWMIDGLFTSLVFQSKSEAVHQGTYIIGKV